MKAVLLFFCLSLLSSIVRAEDPVILPMQALAAVEKNGQIKFMSGNGRFVFTGTVHDVWHGTTINTLADARRSADYLYLDKLKVKIEDLAPLTVGAGAKTVVIFTAPLCTHCTELLQQLPELSEHYRFQLLTLPKDSIESARLVDELSCAKDPAEAAAVLLKGDFTKKVEKKPECDVLSPRKRFITAQLFNVRELPFLIRHDGKIQQGLPKQGLPAWLEGK